MTKLPRPDLDSIEKRCEAATPGPWKPGICEIIESSNHEIICTTMDDSGWETGQHEANHRFITHARQDIPDLLAYARAQEECVRELAAYVQYHRDDATADLLLKKWGL